MKHFTCLTFVLFSIIVFSSISASAQTKTIIGYNCLALIGSSGNGSQCITTKSGKVCFYVSPKTKKAGFGSSPSYEIGAQYRVTLKNEDATRIVFTGRNDKSTKRCELE